MCEDPVWTNREMDLLEEDLRNKLDSSIHQRVMRNKEGDVQKKPSKMKTEKQVSLAADD